MINNINIPGFFKKHRKKFFISIFLFWIIFALLVLAEDEIAVRIVNNSVDPVDRLQYCIRFAIWSLLTPLIIFLAVKFPVQKKSLFIGILMHFLFSLVVIAIEFSIEIPIIRSLTLKINGMVAPVAEYATVFFLKLNLYILLYFVIAGVTYLVLYIESNHQAAMLSKEANIKNQQLQTQLAEARLSMLKMQLDPHFLFNTHHSIVSLMLNDENDKAIKMLTGLSDLLRLSLEDQQQMITLEREIQILKLYLDIQQVRFHDRLKIEFDIQHRSLSQKVPSFILQPLVENAIKHGIAVSSEASKIYIGSQISGDKLILSIKNNGRSIDFKNFREGIGITNIKERLQQLYNNHSGFELKNIDNEGVIALISLPIN